MMSTTNKATLRRFFQEVWNEGNAQSAAGYLAPRYTIHHDPGDPWEGQTLDLAGFMARLEQSRAPFPDQTFTIRHLLADGDQVVAAWEWTGTHLGDLPGFPASGKRVTFSGMTIYFFEDGRLSGHWQITDRLGIYQQLGAP
jgi:steroid delta-isomerase-like uncharacterized protein